jgi:signal transduction histidine kinase
MVVLGVLGLVLCLPIAGLVVFKFYANQLVQQTEESLLAQAATLAATYEELYATQNDGSVPALHEGPITEFKPVFPKLSINAGTILPPRPDAAVATSSIGPEYEAIALPLSRLARAAQVQTLAGYRFLDRDGMVIAGTAELGLSLKGVQEVDQALMGDVASVVRTRIRPEPEPALYALSRGTGVRVFVAKPAVVWDEVIGVVYISRTPDHIFRFLYGERWNLLQAALFVFLSTGLIGWVFWRFITRPIQVLTRQTDIAARSQQRLDPLDHFGTREIETLSRSFQALTERLKRQQDALKTYTAHVTHELKSPLTAVKGAAELLGDPEMTASQRARFLDNIIRDIARIEELLDSMRQFSLTEQLVETGQTTLKDVLPELEATFGDLKFDLENDALILPLHPRALKILLTHMIENAQDHGARCVTLQSAEDRDRVTLRIADDGRGISPGNMDKILTPFFTTRRDRGGTGMGLNIVSAIVEACGGTLHVDQPEKGAQFILSFPSLRR